MTNEVAVLPRGTTPATSERGQVHVSAVDFAFGGQQALRNTDLQVNAGEFFTLLGPSGSGKTTLLRIIAGLLDPDHGTIEIDGDDVTNVPVQRRDIGFVFQNYALFPHLTVAGNIEFGLKVQKVGRRDRVRRIDEILELVALGGFGERLPNQLSGGQQQRVALGRALAQRPRVLLLDEPLGALDRNLREDLGAEIRRIQQDAQTTAIYVTHDQDEAFILSDRIGVMRDGVIRQLGTPADLYRSPSDVFVAQFLGRTNLLAAVVTGTSSTATDVYVGSNVLPGQPCDLAIGSPALVCIRPEQLAVTTDGPAPGHHCVTSGVVSASRFLGHRHAVHVTTPVGPCAADIDPNGPIPAVGDAVTLSVRGGVPAIVAAQPDLPITTTTITPRPQDSQEPKP